MHVFSMNCKADSVTGVLADEKGRRAAIRAFRGLSITKVYLESYRTKIFVEEDLLRAVKKDFEAAGFDVGGCVVPTQMSDRTATGWATTTCFSDESAHRLMQEVVERTASIFDTIIFDDFLFTTCACKFCEAGKGEKSWGEYRTGLLLNVVRERIIKPARAVNRNVKLVIKYPCWYDGYFAGGYDVLRETALFDQTWAGTETRDPESKAAGRMPQGKAFWIQNWMQALGKCGGGWYDPLDCSPETFVEQARNTILGGAQESLLHCYDYLFLGQSSRAKDGGSLKIPKNDLAAQAFGKEVAGLRKLESLVEPMALYGVAAPKKPNCDQGDDAYLHGFLCMLGIPVRAAASLGELAESFISAHCVKFETISEYLEALCSTGRPFAITHAAVEQMTAAGKPVPRAILSAYETCKKAGTCFVKINAQACLLRFEKAWDLMALERLDELRNGLLMNFGLEFYAPSRVALQLYKEKARHIER